MRKLFFLFFFTLFFFALSVGAFCQLRTLNEIFPSMDQHIRRIVFEPSGYIKAHQNTNGYTIFGTERSTRLSAQIINTVLGKNPDHLIESILVIPANSNTVTLLDVYNALGNIQGLKGLLYHSHTREADVPLFEEATRIAGQRQTTPIPDPAPARHIPQTETVYIRLKDINFGNTFYRGQMTLTQSGIIYTFSNFRNITYFFVPVIREDKFTAQLYIEPIHEGILIYSLAGVEIPSIFASRINVDSAISKRLGVIILWASEGISRRARENR
ncbi:MAG: hypothetical protein LBI12_00980 [Treponema sp.]|jgi:hypothetical protein|nr:hypothetical protein [Treponema sp.]